MGPLALVVDDDDHVRELVRLALEKQGFRVAQAADGREALKLADELLPDIVILDLMLPAVDGWEVCRRLRQAGGRVPILMLTARGEEDDEVRGLNLGADDYLVKPFSPRQLVARASALLRRAGTEAGRVLRYPGLVIDTTARRVTVDGEAVQLAPKEFDLLAFLARHPAQVLSRDRLLERVWGWDYQGDARTVDEHVKRLRQKTAGREGHRYIETVWGVGYRFNPDGRSA
ncbi:MAG: response regulator transcription factor [Clostridia bacterium]|nr:response regulator transcription factor [Clostridia bacterium]